MPLTARTRPLCNQSNIAHADVAPSDEVVADTVIPNGKTWEVRQFHGAAAYLDDTVVCLIWDPAGANEILACTHGDATIALEKQVTGDGIKVLRIAMTNDTAAAHILGGSWWAKEL